VQVDQVIVHRSRRFIRCGRFRAERAGLTGSRRWSPQCRSGGDGCQGDVLGDGTRRRSALDPAAWLSSRRVRCPGEPERRPDGRDSDAADLDSGRHEPGDGADDGAGWPGSRSGASPGGSGLVSAAPAPAVPALSKRELPTPVPAARPRSLGWASSAPRRPTSAGISASTRAPWTRVAAAGVGLVDARGSDALAGARSLGSATPGR